MESMETIEQCDDDAESQEIAKDIDIEKNSKLKIGKNRDVWFTFKFIEMIFGIICLVYHINGTLYSVEPQPHTVFFCGTFVGFLIISLLSQIRMLLGATSPPIMESIIAVIGSIAYYFSAFASMYYAEKDFHLMYLSDEEEGRHEFFVICKSQSISSLVCGSIYLLHAVYAIDSCITQDDSENCFDDEIKFSPTGPIQLHLFFRPWLEKIKFFRYLYKRIETLEAVSIWKHTKYEKFEADVNLSPGINIYTFEEPIVKQCNCSKSKKLENLTGTPDEINVNERMDQSVQVGEEYFKNNIHEIILKSFKKRK